jgi:hypothetical protein
MADGVAERRNYIARSGSALYRQLSNDGDGDGKIQHEFKAGCGKGMVKSTKP